MGQDDLGQGIKPKDNLLYLADLLLIDQVCLVEYNNISKLKLIDQELAQRDFRLCLLFAFLHCLDNKLYRGQVLVEAKTVNYCDHCVQSRHTLETETFVVLKSECLSHW